MLCGVLIPLVFDTCGLIRGERLVLVTGEVKSVVVPFPLLEFLKQEVVLEHKGKMTSYQFFYSFRPRIRKNSQCELLVLPRSKLILEVRAIKDPIVVSNAAVAYGTEEYSPGLVGAWFGESDFTNCKDADLIKSLDLSWSEGDDYGKAWSAKWRGDITAPATGHITFHGETAESLTVSIDRNQIIQISEEHTPELNKTRETISTTAGPSASWACFSFYAQPYGSENWYSLRSYFIRTSKPAKAI